ncbi:MAG: porin [Saprospiraceae bacterium]|nr:porin [Saprospiraceae bacterium]
MKTVILIIFSIFIFHFSVRAQIDPYKADTINQLITEVSKLTDKFKNLSFSGYLQAQFQKAQSSGIESFNGGDFGSETDNRFMIRRGRMRIDYTILNDKAYRKIYFVFQFDASERGVVMRDMFLRLFENKWHNFILTTGMYNRPFGYELQMSSALRESPERGRMSQILMRTERDLGAMISFRPQDKNYKLYFINADLGIFNGTGLTAPLDYDKYKDVIARLSVNNLRIGNTKVTLSGGVSYLNGGVATLNKVVYQPQKRNQEIWMVADTSAVNLTRRLPRTYYGADCRLKVPLNLQNTLEVRAEYMIGTQPSFATSSVTPFSIPMDPVYIRPFHGAYFYLVTNLANKHQMVLKYDWYDPNSRADRLSIDSQEKGFSKADIKYSTWGFGYSYFFNPTTKVVFYYELVRNEKTLLPEFSDDKKDNLLTIRTQVLF